MWCTTVARLWQARHLCLSRSRTRARILLHVGLSKYFEYSDFFLSLRDFLSSLAILACLLPSRAQSLEHRAPLTPMRCKDARGPRLLTDSSDPVACMHVAHIPARTLFRLDGACQAWDRLIPKRGPYPN